MKIRLTKEEKRWILYDVGNSAFVLLVATILPIYFNSLAQNAGLSSVTYLAYWGYTASVATLVVALFGPIVGSVSDRRGRKKPLFLACVLLGAVCCLLLGVTKNWFLFLIGTYTQSRYHRDYNVYGHVFFVSACGSMVDSLYDSVASDIPTETLCGR